MAGLNQFCTPSQEMDEIARKMRAGEPDVNYAALFAKGARPHNTIDEERDPAALSIRLQSERHLSVKDAQREALSMLGLPDPQAF